MRRTVNGFLVGGGSGALPLPVWRPSVWPDPFPAREAWLGRKPKNPTVLFNSSHRQPSFPTVALRANIPALLDTLTDGSLLQIGDNEAQLASKLVERLPHFRLGDRKKFVLGDSAGMSEAGVITVIIR